MGVKSGARAGEETPLRLLVSLFLKHLKTAEKHSLAVYRQILDSNAGETQAYHQR